MMKLFKFKKEKVTANVITSACEKAMNVADQGCVICA